MVNIRDNKNSMEFFLNSQKVLVVIPHYNQNEFLQETINSILKQTYKNLDWFVVDDNSEIKPVYKADKITHMFINKVNVGLAECRNVGLTPYGMGFEYIMFLDSDDLIHPDYIKLAVEELEQNKDLAFITCYYEKFGDETGIIETNDKLTDSILSYNPFCYCGLFRREVLQKVGGYKKFWIEADGKKIFGMEDWRLWIDLYKAGYQGKNLKQVMFYWRRHGNTMERQMQPYATELKNKMLSL